MARPWPRPPRSEEVALIRQLSRGPKKIVEGPIGRCVKRGWCRILMEPTPDGKSTVALYETTEEGRAFL